MGTSANTLLIIGLVWPEPNTTAAGKRMLQLIDFFLSQDYSITFCSTASKSEYSFDLSVLGIKTESIILNDSSFDALVKNLHPEIVLFDRFLTEEQFGWRVAEFAPNATRILDTEDLHSLRKVRERLFRAKTEFTTSSWLESDNTKRELASIYRCDLSLLISTYEMHLLLDIVKMDKSQLLHLPFQVNKISSAQIAKWMDFSERKDFLFIGNGKHAPNIDAILWLNEALWPMIRQSLPNANLHVYGSYLPENILQMHSPATGFYVEGWVENLSEVMEQHRINLAPLRFGAGIKGKLIDGMLCGIPSITTPIGAEGMHGDLPWGGMIADTATQLAQAAVRLYNEMTDWQQSQENGVNIINNCYDKAVLNNRLLNKIQSLTEDLSKHRAKNLIGALLRHQTMNSTKYMAKWIEEKNKR